MPDSAAIRRGALVRAIMSAISIAAVVAVLAAAGAARAAAGAGATAPSPAASASALPGPPSASAAAARRKPPAARVRLVDINSASKAELKTLPGIGDAEADAIVQNRPYQTKTELVTKKVLPTGPYLSLKNKVVAMPKARPKHRPKPEPDKPPA